MYRNFLRRTRVTTGGKSWLFPDVKITFNIPFSANSSGNTGLVSLYNLTEESINLFERDNPILIESGYVDDMGTILSANIETVKTQWNEPEKILKVTVGDATDTWLNQQINKSWKAGISAREVITDIINIIGLELAEFEVPNNVTFKKGKNFSTTGKRALEEMAVETGAKLHVIRGRIHFTAPPSGVKTAIVLNSDTGLVSSPEPVSERENQGYTVKTLLNYHIKTDTILKLESSTANGLYRVDSGRYISDFSNHICVLEVSAV